MADRLFVDLTADGRVSVGPWLEGELPGGATGEPCPLDWPLDAGALAPGCRVTSMPTSQEVWPPY